MKNIAVRMFTAGLLCALSAVSSANDLPQPGLYNIEGKVSSDQLPIAKTNNSEQCIKENDFLEDPLAWLKDQSGQECDVVTYTIADGNIELEMHCIMEQMGKATIVGNGSYTSSGFQLINTMSIDASGLKMEIKTDVTGKRAGDC